MLGTTIAVGIGPYIGGALYDSLGSFGCFTAASVFSALALISMIFIKVSQPEDVVGDNQSFSGLEKVFEYGAIPVSFFTAIYYFFVIWLFKFHQRAFEK